MIGKLLGKVLALPIRVVAVPFRIMDKAVGVRDDLNECTPGTILRGMADAIDGACKEIDR